MTTGYDSYKGINRKCLHLVELRESYRTPV